MTATGPYVYGLACKADQTRRPTLDVDLRETALIHIDLDKTHRSPSRPQPTQLLPDRWGHTVRSLHCDCLRSRVVLCGDRQGCTA